MADTNNPSSALFEMVKTSTMAYADIIRDVAERARIDGFHFAVREILAILIDEAKKGQAESTMIDLSQVAERINQLVDEMRANPKRIR